jgi:signal transduction histidine kinase
MSVNDLVDRLASLSGLAGIPRHELEWLVAHGRLEVYEAGAVIARKGERIEKLWLLLSGQVAIRVDRGAGPRKVMQWDAGDVSGLLPYSRMSGPPGDNYMEEATELVAIDEEHFPELIHRCPTFTSHTVHLMLDRARNFNTSDLQDEKMISLGKLAAGLAHELNNPASATVRGAESLRDGLASVEAASRALGAAGLSEEEQIAIERLRTDCLTTSTGADLSPLARADREDEIAEWLELHGSDPAHATPLADSAVPLEALESLAAAVPADKLGASLRWIAAGCATHSLSGEIERAANRIYDLVGAVKNFTQMDHLAGPESVDVAAGLRDTLTVVGSKTEARGAAVTLDVEADLPPVRATAGELNQVWFHLIDNALDAIPESGKIEISARGQLDRVEVCIADDGPGIPPDVLPWIFDPFFTTKPPGQGTGLGLDIARRLLRRYQGEISASSRPGRTELRVSLLSATAARAAD